MYTKYLITATLVGLVAAAPQPLQSRQSADTVGAIATRSGDLNVHLRSITENGLKFWLGKDTTTYCPNTSCPPGNETQFIVSTSSNGVSMNVDVPGGQVLYVAADGSLSATQAHASVVAGGLLAPFTYTAATNAGGVGTIQFNSSSFVACPGYDAGVYQIFATGRPEVTLSTECIGIGFDTASIASNPVWQYI